MEIELYVVRFRSGLYSPRTVRCLIEIRVCRRKGSTLRLWMRSQEKGLSKNVQCSPARSIHILYNHAPSGGMEAHTGQ